MGKWIPNKALKAFTFPSKGEYYWIQLPPKGTTDLRGYIVPAEHLKEAIEKLRTNNTSKFVVWRMIPIEKDVRRHNKHGEYSVKVFGR